MLEIINALPSHVDEISALTKIAFELYRENLRVLAPLSALTETREDILRDITNNRVLVAVENDKVLGCVRYSKLSPDVAYLYRFAVDTEERSRGVGAELLAKVVKECQNQGFACIALHTNSKYYKLARYYYGMNFYVHSTDNSRGYIRALFIKELKADLADVDLSCAYLK